MESYAENYTESSGEIMKKWYVIVSLLALSQLVACSKSAPKCGDSKTKDLVVEILTDNGFKSDEYTKVVLNLDAIRTSGVDKDTGKNSCEGQLNVEKTVIKSRGWGATDVEGYKTTDKKNLQFTSELTSEGKHYVSVRR